MSLTNRLSCVLANRERGAVGAIFALLFSMVVLGAAIMTINVSAAFDEHRQVRSGADAVAEAVAAKCVPSASASTDCAQASTTLASRIADENAVDRSTIVQQVCASRAMALPNLPTCRTDNLAPLDPTTCQEAIREGRPCRSLLSHCPEFRRGVNASALEYLEVRTRSAANNEPSVVGSLFGAEGGPVDACTRVGYLAPNALVSGLPITISRCVIDLYRSQRGALAPPPPYTSSQARTWETAVVLHSSGKGEPCAGPAGKNAPGNFGYLDANGVEPCQAYTEVNTYADGDTGNGNPRTRGCSDQYLRSLLGKTIPLPVFDAVTGTGNNVEYRIVGYTGFHFTGWKLAGTSNTSRVTRPELCGNAGTCLFGMFTRAVTPTPVPVDLDAQKEGRSFGASTPAIWD